MAADGTAPREPRILVFSTNPISDPGIDLAGSAHLNYSPGVTVISVPCSSGVRPDWLVHAVEKGFDGVFVAADGGDCALVPDCTAKTAAAVERAQKALTDHGQDPRRLKMGAICSVCAEPFVSHMKQFADTLRKL
ncbi:MAG: hydrogenase iron-sulfur subunit [Alphaproteobacteria bacterium]|nr:hydrogenase iron-sulfur subunit [Alphaproteobacteria bacterium]MDE2267206.1 hydrogenase iron-sulfur subunit [Alphaproteobacteria bacterium]MDE2500574.1 hydrogenase iron-sulfur subunit [Alphaproteobacteria bacterium]